MKIAQRVVLLCAASASLAWGQFGSTTAARIVRAAGAPASNKCLTAGDVGKVYVQSDVAAATNPLSVCSNTGVGTYGWLSGGGGGGSGTVTNIATSNGITGGPITTTGTISGVNAAADGTTKGVAAFTAADFSAASGVISLNYASGQKATGSVPGFLSSADWTTFNNKQAALGFTAENVANKATSTSLGNSDTLYPSQNAVKAYVDTVAAGINPAIAALAASTANIAGTYTHVAGIGDFFTVTATGAFTLDGIAINTIGQRVLLKDQTAGLQNGLYTATVVGSIGVSPVFTRALDYDTPADINSTGVIPVQSGTANTTTSWLLTSSVTTVGTDALTYVRFSYNPTTLVLTTRSIATTSPLGGGGDLSADRTFTCTTCVVASSPGAGLARFAGSTQTVTSSELSGDCTTSGSNVITCTQINGGNFTVTPGGVPSKIAGITTVDLGAPVLGWESATTANTSNQSVTIATAPTAGIYTINYYANQNALTGGGACTANFTFNWTDAGGARSLSTGNMTLGTAQASAGYLNGTVGPFRVNSGNVTFTSTISGSCGSGSYDMDAIMARSK